MWGGCSARYSAYVRTELPPAVKKQKMALFFHTKTGAKKLISAALVYRYKFKKMQFGIVIS